MSLIHTLAHHAAERPDSIAICSRAESLTYAALYDRARLLANRLRRHCVGVLAIAADNSMDWPIIDIGARIAGTALVPLPLFFSPEQLQHVLRDSGATAIALDSAAAPLATRLDAQAVGTLTHDIGLWRLWRPGARRVPTSIAKISYTSGTTGAPKGVCLDQDTQDRVAKSLCAATESIEIDRHLCLLPLATLLENIAGVYAPILRGATIALPSLSETGLHGASNLDIVALLACLEREQPQSIIVLPQMLAALVAAVEGGARLPSTLRFIAVGGGCVARTLLERADRLGLPVYEGYGLTECASVVALNTPEARRIGSVGRPLRHAQVRIDDRGEIFVAGAVMSGYLSDAESGHAPPSEIATGDLGHLDSDGYLHITGRRKNVFITSFGRNVSPEWVEAALAGTASIAQAALFGEARPWNVAVIVPGSRDDRNARLVHDIERTNADLPGYARVHRWILADEPFTTTNGLLTANGRIRRSAVWARYGARIDACYNALVDACA